MASEIITQQLIQLGYEPVQHPGHVVSFTFAIPHGRFRDQQVEIALQAPNFPDIPPPGPHIKPFLLPINPGKGEHPYYGVHNSTTPSAEFQYWSRPFPSWDTTEKNMRVYLAFLRTLFDFE